MPAQLNPRQPTTDLKSAAFLFKHPTVATFAPLLAGCLIAWLVFNTARQTEDQRIRAEFLKDVERKMGNIRSELIRCADSLYSLRNLFLLAETVQPEEFDRVAANLEQRHPAVRSLAWLPSISADELDLYLAWARKNISVSMVIHERDEAGSPAPLGKRAHYTPVYYQTSIGQGLLQPGEDLSVRPEWAAALALARDSARVVLTPRMPDRGTAPLTAAVLAIAPIYLHNPSPEALPERERLSTGFVTAEIDLPALIDTAARHDPNHDVNVVIHDVSNGGETLLHSTLPNTSAKSPGFGEDSLRRNGQTESLTLAARAWRLKFTPTEAWIRASDSRTPQIAAAVCLAFAALLSRFLRTVVRRNQKVETLVSDRTAELLGANRRLSAEIAHRERTEREREDSEERFRITFEEAPAGIGHIDLQGRYLRVNDQLCAITGYTRKELLTLAWTDITHPDDLEKDQLSVRELLANGGPVHSMEKRYIRKGGSFVWVNLTVALVRDGAAQPAYFIAIVTDQSRFRQARESLQTERNLLRTLVDGLPDSVYIKDRDGRYLMNNLADTKLLGVANPEDALGKTVFDFAALRKHADLYFKDDQSIIATGRAVVSREEPFTRPDGSDGWFLTTKLPLRDAKGEITGILGISSDITRRRFEEQERLKINHKLESTQKLEAMGLLAGGIAHDFNNLLTGIHGHAGLLRLQSQTYPELQTSIGQIEQAAQRASELCQQMLDYAGQNQQERQRLDLNSTIKQTLPLLKHSVHKKACLSFEPAENLPAVEGNPAQMRQVIMNLVINASDALEENHGVIRVVTGMIRADRAYLDGMDYDDQLPPGDYLYIDVTDNGCGMPRAVIERIFDPFYTTKKEGRGLGLATVIGIIRTHGGGTRIHSQPGQGTVFRVIFPVCDAPAEQFPEDEQTGWNWRGSGRVLVIDDEETVRTVAARILEALGFSPVIAANGEEGLNLFREHADDYRMILSDVSMPVMDGAETCARIRKIRHDIPIVLMSG
jgi:PAS domain S-box-containing protein